MSNDEDASDGPDSRQVTSGRRLWIVRATDPGLDAFVASHMLAVNFHIREDLSRLSASEISSRYRNPVASLLSMSHTTRDLVIATDSARGPSVLLGEVAGAYEYEDPATIPDHPHTRRVAWTGKLKRDEVAAVIGQRIPRGYATVFRLPAQAEAFAALTDGSRRKL